MRAAPVLRRWTLVCRVVGVGTTAPLALLTRAAHRLRPRRAAVPAGSRGPCVCAQAAAGVPKTQLARQHGIHRDTAYRYLAADGACRDVRPTCAIGGKRRGRSSLSRCRVPWLRSRGIPAVADRYTEPSCIGRARGGVVLDASVASGRPRTGCASRSRCGRVR